MGPGSGNSTQWEHQIVLPSPKNTQYSTRYRNALSGNSVAWQERSVGASASAAKFQQCSTAARSTVLNSGTQYSKTWHVNKSPARCHVLHSICCRLGSYDHFFVIFKEVTFEVLRNKEHWRPQVVPMLRLAGRVGGRSHTECIQHESQCEASQCKQPFELPIL